MKDDSKWWEKTNICAPTEDLNFKKRVKELENSLSIALDLNDTLQRHNAKIKKRVEEVEGEIEDLKAQLARAKEDHQYDNMVHEKELELLKNPLNKLRDRGLM